MIPLRPNLALVLAILETLVFTSTAQPPRPALTKQAFRQLLKLRLLPTKSDPLRHVFPVPYLSYPRLYSRFSRHHPLPRLASSLTHPHFTLYPHSAVHDPTHCPLPLTSLCRISVLHMRSFPTFAYLPLPPAPCATFPKAISTVPCRRGSGLPGRAEITADEAAKRVRSPERRVWGSV